MKLYEENGITYSVREWLDNSEFDVLFEALTKQGDIDNLSLVQVFSLVKEVREIFKTLIIDPKIEDTSKLPASLSVRILVNLMKTLPTLFGSISLAPENEKKS